MIKYLTLIQVTWIKGVSLGICIVLPAAGKFNSFHEFLMGEIKRNWNNSIEGLLGTHIHHKLKVDVLTIPCFCNYRNIEYSLNLIAQYARVNTTNFIIKLEWVM